MKRWLLIAFLVLTTTALAGELLKRGDPNGVRVIEINGRDAIVFHEWIKVEPEADWQYVEVAIAMDVHRHLHEIAEEPTEK